MTVDEGSSSRFVINFVRDVFLYGETSQVVAVAKALKPYPYLNPRDGTKLQVVATEPHFVVMLADFSSLVRMQASGRAFAEATPLTAHRVVMVIAPETLTREQMLFAQEIGARYVCAGPLRIDELRNYLKRICVEAHQAGSLSAFEADLQKAAQKRDRKLADSIMEKLKGMPETEESLRLMARGSLEFADGKRAEAYLKRLLRLNDQNLWAANALGKLYLRSGRATYGIEMLEKLSRFHELSSDRLLALGDAYAEHGMGSEAESTFAKGALLAPTDERFVEGAAKVKLLSHDLAGALTLLGDRPLTEAVLSFLNMRAIMACRAGRFDEALAYYQDALGGSGGNDLTKAKVHFNVGLAHTRAGHMDLAYASFKASVTLGGDRFARAKGPLAAVDSAIKRAKRPLADGAVAALPIGEDLEWEVLS